jgi:hypothetical protein
MRPEDIGAPLDTLGGGVDAPLAADLRPLDLELEESGARARRMLHGRTQPTNYFAMDLRARLLGAYSGDEPAGSATLDVTAPRGRAPVSKPFVQPRRGETATLTQVMPRVGTAAPSLYVSARWGLLAAAVATGLVIVGALGTGAIPR